MIRPLRLQGSVQEELAGLASEAAVIRGAIAYWTIDHALLGDGLARGLAAAGGFLCVDIHHPTSIDNLARLRETGAEVRLHLYDLAGQTEDIGVKGMPPHLMHAKMLLDLHLGWLEQGQHRPHAIAGIGDLRCRQVVV